MIDQARTFHERRRARVWRRRFELGAMVAGAGGVACALLSIAFGQAFAVSALGFGAAVAACLLGRSWFE